MAQAGDGRPTGAVENLAAILKREPQTFSRDRKVRMVTDGSMQQMTHHSTTPDVRLPSIIVQCTVTIEQ